MRHRDKRDIDFLAFETHDAAAFLQSLALRPSVEVSSTVWSECGILLLSFGKALVRAVSVPSMPVGAYVGSDAALQSTRTPSVLLYMEANHLL